MPSRSAPQTRPADDECIFCKIIAGKIPCAKVYEDADVLAFLDISPIAKGHTLVVPKGHYPTLLEFPEHEAPALVAAMKKIGNALREAIGAEGFNCFQNNFGPAGQVVFHVHWHIVPRFTDDGIPDWSGKSYADTAEMQQLAKSVCDRLSVAHAGGTS